MELTWLFLQVQMVIGSPAHISSTTRTKLFFELLKLSLCMEHSTSQIGSNLPSTTNVYQNHASKGRWCHLIIRLLGGGLLAAGVAGVVGVGVALLQNQGLLTDQSAFSRIAQRFESHKNTLILLPTSYFIHSQIEIFSVEPPPGYPEWTSQEPTGWS